MGGLDEVLQSCQGRFPKSPDQVLQIYQSNKKNSFPRLLELAKRAAPLSLFFFEPPPFTSNLMGGHPTHLSTSGGFLFQKAKTHLQPDEPTRGPT